MRHLTVRTYRRSIERFLFENKNNFNLLFNNNKLDWFFKPEIEISTGKCLGAFQDWRRECEDVGSLLRRQVVQIHLWVVFVVFFRFAGFADVGRWTATATSKRVRGVLNFLFYHIQHWQCNLWNVVYFCHPNFQGNVNLSNCCYAMHFC